MARNAGRLSAGILLYRCADSAIEVLLVHPGGPFWVRKDAGAWSIPKGIHEPGVDSDLLTTAIREFSEELGLSPPPLAVSRYLELGSTVLAGGKTVVAWAVEGDLDPAQTASNLFELEWPAGSGRIKSYPEVDRAEWFRLDAAKAKINQGQLPLLDRLTVAIEAP